MLLTASLFNRYSWDLLVLGIYFAVILTIGLSQKSKSESVEGYAMGDRQTPWWAVLASILAAEISAATFLGAPASGFENRSWVYAQFAIGTILARIIVSFLFIPLFYRHRVISLYEYLETRFGRRTRLFASATFLLTRVLAIGTRLFVATIPMVLAYGLITGTRATPGQSFITFGVAIFIITALTALYTMAGGIRAVIWTDFIQVGVLVISIGFTIWFLLASLPEGMDSVSKVINSPAFFDFAEPEQPGFIAFLKHILTSEYTIWAAIIGSTFVTMSTHGIDQDTVQRMLTAKNRRQSAFATILSGLVDLPVVSAFIFVGVLLFAYYQNFPDPNLPLDYKGNLDTRAVFPHFVLTKMPPGLCGLVVAGVMATAMGSLSTALNALATSFSRDFFFPDNSNDLPEKRKVRILRISTLFFAFLIIIVGMTTAYYMAMHPETKIIPLVLGILGFTFGSLLGIFLLAIFTKTRGNDMGNIIAMICGFAAVVFFSNADLLRLANFGTFGADGKFIPALVISFPWRITLGTFVTIIVASMFRTPPKGAGES